MQCAHDAIQIMRKHDAFVCYASQINCETRSVAAGFGRHGMSPPGCNDTGTALGQVGPERSRDLATLTFDVGGHGAFG